MTPNAEVLAQMIGVAGIGGLLGTVIAKKIEITDLPQLVAGFHRYATIICCYLIEGPTRRSIATVTPVARWQSKKYKYMYFYK